MPMRPLPSHASTREVTKLTPEEEVQFQQWLRASRITDADHPETRYDYRGLFKELKGTPVPQSVDRHFPDTFKQHGHPLFSAESIYSRGRQDGGQWLDEQTLIPPPSASHDDLDLLLLRKLMK